MGSLGKASEFRIPRLRYANWQEAVLDLSTVLSEMALTRVRYGTGSPEGSVTAGIGSLYVDTAGSTGTTLYVKESGTGNTGWAAK